MFRLAVLVFLIFFALYLLYIHFGKDLEEKLRDEVKLKPLISDPCVFLENDIVTDNVYDMYGSKITQNKKIECSKCGDYTYKGPDGCSPYQKDFLYSVRDRDTNTNVGMCSSLSFPRECKFKSKNPPQNE